MTTKMTEDLSKNAVTIKLSIPTYEGNVKWREGAKELADAHAASEERITSTIRALQPKARAKIMAVRAAARQAWIDATMPWTDDGKRLCPIKRYRAVRDILEQRKVEFEEAKQELVNRYDDIRAEAVRELNGLMSKVNFPTKEQFANRFQFEISVGVIATSQDVRIETLSENELNRIRQEIDAENRKQIAESQRSALGRVAERIEHLVRKMTEDLTGKTTKKGKAITRPHFKDSVINNIVEIAEEMRGMNVLDSAAYDRFLKNIKSMFGKLNPTELRDNDSARKDAAKLGKVILDEIDQFAF